MRSHIKPELVKTFAPTGVHKECYNLSCYSYNVDSWQAYVRRHESISSSIDIECQNRLSQLGHALTESSMKSQSIVFTAGNGGSASTADHFTADLGQTKRRTGLSIRSICLNAHLGLNSAFSNDLSYEDALTAQLKNYASENHILVVFSASGNSKNIIRLLEFASSEGMRSWAFLGFDGGNILKMPEVDCILFQDTKRDYGVVENIHLMACHFLIDLVTESIKANK